jgi:acyl carrier protein
MLNREDIIGTINSALGLNLDVASTPCDVEFKSLGIDSLDVFSVLVALEGVTGKKVSDDDVKALTTIDSLASYFNT